MTRDAYEHTLMGRTFAALRESLEDEHRRGVWITEGWPWESHPSWTTPPDHENWHKNWGELLNYHTTVHVRRVNTNGILAFRLDVRVTHPDRARLELVKSVTGGTIEDSSGPRTVNRLRIERLAAFQALKAGRLYVDPANSGLIEVIDAGMRFYREVPDRGQAPSDTQLANQEYWEEQVDRLIGAYVGVPRPPHDCSEGARRAGTADWTADLGRKAPDRTFF